MEEEKLNEVEHIISYYIQSDEKEVHNGAILLEELLQAYRLLEKSDTSKEQSSINYYNEYKKYKNLYEQDEKVIQKMAKALKSYANLGILINCPAEYDGRYNYKNCKIDVTKNRTDKTNALCNKCIIDYFRKRCE